MLCTPISGGIPTLLLGLELRSSQEPESCLPLMATSALCKAAAPSALDLLSSGAVRLVLSWKQASSLYFLLSFSPFDNCTETLADWDCYIHASLKQPCSGTQDSSQWQHERDCRLIHLVLTHENHLWNPCTACCHSRHISAQPALSQANTRAKHTEKTPLFLVDSYSFMH